MNEKSIKRIKRCKYVLFVGFQLQSNSYHSNGNSNSLNNNNNNNVYSYLIKPSAVRASSK
jgi:hypothetical protein